MSKLVPDFSKPNTIPGNRSILMVVGHGMYQEGWFHRTWTQFNRKVDASQDGKIFWLHGVEVGEPVMVPGSLKMGQEITHPEYKITYTDYTAPIGQGTCVCVYDGFLSHPAKFETLSICVLSHGGLVTDPLLVLGPPYIPALPWGAQPGSGCF